MAKSDDDGRLSANELGRAAFETVEELTGHPPEAVTGLEWDGEFWNVRLDVLELARIPNTTDLLATYEVKLDESGALRGYRRRGRFLRGQPSEE